jgi:hypothetical protein
MIPCVSCLNPTTTAAEVNTPWQQQWRHLCLALLIPYPLLKSMHHFINGDRCGTPLHVCVEVLAAAMMPSVSCFIDTMSAAQVNAPLHQRAAARRCMT